MMALFVGHSGAYGTHGAPTQVPGGLKWEIKTTARTVRGPTTLEMWEDHLRGERPLGIIPIREDSTCLWACIDVDRYDTDLTPIVQRVSAEHLPLVCARSKSGGLRIYLFLSDPQPASAVLSVMRDLAARLGLAECEVFPKQTTVLGERGDVGNWMVMPYFGGTYNGKIKEQVGLKRTGAEMTIGEFLSASEGHRLRAEQFEELGRARTSNQPPPPRAGGSRRGTPEPAVPFGDGPPCLQHLSTQGVGESEGRNATLFMMGSYYKRMDPSGWAERLAQANARWMQPPLAPDEVQGLVRSLAKKDYEYTCKTQPMSSHCDSALCRTRRHGVGTAGEYPQVSGLTVIDADPPIWFLQVGERRYEVGSDDLFDYNRMIMVFGERGHVIYRPMKREQWLGVLGEAMTGLNVLPAPQDVGRRGQFHEVLEDMLVNRWRGEHREDLLLGKPWEDEAAQRHYFRLQDLMRLLDREGLRGLTRTQVMRYLEEHGGGPGEMQVKGKTIRVWWVPSSAVVEDPEVPPPKSKGGPV
jgi:hypothetical protein